MYIVIAFKKSIYCIIIIVYYIVHSTHAFCIIRAAGHLNVNYFYTLRKILTTSEQ